MLYLASKSPRRKEILKMLGIEFEVLNNTFDESLIKLKSPKNFVLEASYKKAESVTEEVKEGFILGVDTIGYLGDSFLLKPKDKSDAIETLNNLRNRKHIVFSGMTVLKIKDYKVLEAKSRYAKTKVFFGDFSDELINEYVESGVPLDKAASYGIQDRGALFVEKINGCFYNVMGLPVYELNVVLTEIGYYKS